MISAVDARASEPRPQGAFKQFDAVRGKRSKL